MNAFKVSTLLKKHERGEILTTPELKQLKEAMLFLSEFHSNPTSFYYQFVLSQVDGYLDNRRNNRNYRRRRVCRAIAA